MSFESKPAASRYAVLQYVTAPTESGNYRFEDLGATAFASRFASGVTTLGSVREMSRVGAYREPVVRKIFGTSYQDQQLSGEIADNFVCLVNVPAALAQSGTLMNNYRSKSLLLWRLVLLDRGLATFTNTTIATVPNSIVYFFGQIGGWGVTPALSDSVIYEFEIAVSGSYYGIYTL